VKISVLVATIQTRFNDSHYMGVDIALKVVVEKVSLEMANSQGSVGPKS